MKLSKIIQLTPTDYQSYEVSSNLDFLQQRKMLIPSLYVIGGKPSSCKTALSCQIALDILEHNDNTELVILSLDDDVEYTTGRILKQIYSIQNNSLQSSNIEANNLSELYKYTDTISNNLLDRIDIYNDDVDTSTTKGIEAIVNKIANDGKTAIVILDYIQRIKIRKDDNFRICLNGFLEDIKDIQQRTKSIVIILSQVNASGETRESSEIVNCADTVLMLDKRSNNYKIIIQKCKRGQSGASCKCTIDSNYYLTLGIQTTSKTDGNTKRKTKKTTSHNRSSNDFSEEA